MSNYICWLVTVLDDTELIKCALKVNRDYLTGDCAEYPLEWENRIQIHKLLPLHVQSCGPIVAIEKISEVEVVN